MTTVTAAPAPVPAPVFVVNDAPIPAEFTKEFVSLLHEQVTAQVWESLGKCFDALKIPEEIRALVVDFEALTYWGARLESNKPLSRTEYLDLMEAVLGSLKEIAAARARLETAQDS